MYELDKSKAKSILIHQEGMKEHQADEILRNLVPFHDALRPAAERWIETQEIDDFEVDGVGISDIIRNRRSHFLFALVFMNQILRTSKEQEKEELLEIARTPKIVRDNLASAK